MTPSPRLLAAATLASLALAAPATAVAQDGPPPPPSNPKGHAVTTVAQGVPTPTAFAFRYSNVFVAGYGDFEPGGSPGGVFLLKNGVPQRVEGTLEGPVTGLTWHNNGLYVASNTALIRYSGWTGKGFKYSKILFDSHGETAPFNGIAIDSRNRLFAGVTFTDEEKYDHANDPTPFAQSVVRLTTVNGKPTLKTVARGIRQPFQLTFIGNDPNPWVTDEAQDNREPAPPDQLLHPREGQNFGFASCTWEPGSPCQGFNRPFRLLPQHSSPTGIDHIGNTLYVALFSGIGDQGPAAVALSSKDPNSPIEPVLEHYVAPVVALGANRGRIYTGDLTGSVYSVKP